MPFAVSTCDITVISLESNKISWTNRADNYYGEGGIATINKPAGSLFTMSCGETINLASLDTNNSDTYISNIDYQLRLYSGYIEYGVNCTKGGGASSVNARLPNIHLNIIARV